MKRTIQTLLAIALLGLALPAPAALLARFSLDEGLLDPFATTILSDDSVYLGTLTGGTPAWISDELAPPLVARNETSAAITNVAVGRAVVTTFYGTNDTGQSVLGARARTVAMWIRTAAVPTGSSFGYLLTYGSVSSTPGGRFSVRLDSNPGITLGKLRLEISSGSVSGTSTFLCDGQWHHVAVVCPAGARISDVVLYADGNIQQTTTTTPTVLINTVTNGNPVHVANYTPLNANATFLGAIDDVRIYDEALNASQVAELVYGPGSAPGITQEPASQSVHLGVTAGSVTFNVGVSGSPSQFTWKKNGVKIPDATNQTHTISPVTAADLASYSVAITNAYGGTSSAPASLTWSTPPIDPAEQTALVGGAANFRITMPAQSTGYTYQWLKGGVPIGAATSSNLSLSSLTLAATADYSVWVMLSGQSATSAPAALHVLTAPASGYAKLVIQDGAAAYWRMEELNGESVATDLTGFHPGGYSNYLGGELEQPGALLGESDLASAFFRANWIEVPYSPALQHNTSFSLEAWVIVNAASGRQSLLCSRNQFFSSGYELAANGALFQFRTGNSTAPGSQVWNDLNAGAITPGVWQHVVATFDGTIKRLYTNGVLAGSQTVNVLATAVPLRIGAGETYNPTPGEYLSGVLDEAAVYWKALTAAQVTAHYQAGKSGPPLTITREGENVVISWPGFWMLQRKLELDGNPNTWEDLTTISPYVVTLPGWGLEFFRLRSF